MPPLHVLFVLGWMAVAQETEPPIPESADPTSVADPFRAPFAEIFEQAKAAYLRGDFDEATRIFEALHRRTALDATVDAELSAEARIYLGELRYNRGDYEGAAAVFREVLRQNPDQPINPYRHPTEVVGLYELVRQSVRRDLEAASLSAERPFPAWGYAPFGVPQFGLGQTRRGATYAALQVGFGLASLATYAHLRYINNAQRIDPDLAEDQFRRVQLERFLVQWPVTLGFYATWAISAADARRTHATRQ